MYSLQQNFSNYSFLREGRDNVVGMDSRYRLEGPGIESQWGRDFLHLSRLALGATQPPVKWVPSLCARSKQLGRGIEHPPPHLGLRLKEE
jgi:hypothetical protein